MTKTLAEFESSYYEMAGYVDYDSYNQATNPIYVFENVTIPLLILNAEDDPVCHIKNFEPYKDMIRQMPNIAVVTTKKGSHCGFYEGALRLPLKLGNQADCGFFEIGTTKTLSIKKTYSSVGLFFIAFSRVRLKRLHRLSSGLTKLHLQ